MLGSSLILPLFAMACSANHSKGSSATSALGAGIIVGQPAWLQRKINLRPQHRGVHVVTEEILRQVSPLADPIKLFFFVFDLLCKACILITYRKNIDSKMSQPC